MELRLVWVEGLVRPESGWKTLGFLIKVIPEPRRSIKLACAPMGEEGSVGIQTSRLASSD